MVNHSNVHEEEEDEEIENERVISHKMTNNNIKTACLSIISCSSKKYKALFHLAFYSGKSKRTRKENHIGNLLLVFNEKRNLNEN